MIIPGTWPNSGPTGPEEHMKPQKTQSGITATKNKTLFTAEHAEGAEKNL